MFALPPNALTATVLFSVNELVNTYRDDGVLFKKKDFAKFVGMRQIQAR